MHPIGSNGLRVELEPDRERVTVRILGEIDLMTAGDFETPVRELLDRGFGTVVVDLRDVTFIDSTGIAVLISSHQHAENLGAHLSIVVGGSGSRQVLELSGAIDYLDVA